MKFVEFSFLKKTPFVLNWQKQKFCAHLLIFTFRKNGKMHFNGNPSPNLMGIKSVNKSATNSRSTPYGLLQFVFRTYQNMDVRARGKFTNIDICFHDII